MGLEVANKTVEIEKTSTLKGSIETRKRWCKGCNLCVDACPKGVLSLDEMGKVQAVNASECSGCGMCEATCPDFAIRVIKYA